MTPEERFSSRKFIIAILGLCLAAFLGMVEVIGADHVYGIFCLCLGGYIGGNVAAKLIGALKEWIDAKRKSDTADTVA